MFGGRLNYNTTRDLDRNLDRWVNNSDSAAEEFGKVAVGAVAHTAVAVGETAINVVKAPFSLIHKLFWT